MKLASVVLCTLLFNFAAAAIGECDASPLGYACMKTLADYFNLHWTLQGSLLHVALEGLTFNSTVVEWVGFCFAERPGQMYPADAVIGWVDVNGAEVLPYRITTASVFAEDEDILVTLTNATVTQDDNRTIVQFTRALTQGRVRVRPDRETPINFAVGDVDGLRYHRARGSGTVHLAAEPGDGRTTAFVPPLRTEATPSPMMSPESMPAPASEPEVAEDEDTEQTETARKTGSVAEAQGSMEEEDAIQELLDNL